MAREEDAIAAAKKKAAVLLPQKKYDGFVTGQIKKDDDFLKSSRSITVQFLISKIDPIFDSQKSDFCYSGVLRTSKCDFVFILWYIMNESLHVRSCQKVVAVK